jgi:hypothetical protein
MRDRAGAARNSFIAEGSFAQVDRRSPATRRLSIESRFTKNILFAANANDLVI